MTHIEDYALLGNCHGAALVSRAGSIDWLCWPRFDSSACFAALLGSEGNGRWKIAPHGDYRVHRRYQGDSLVLETIFETDTGSCRILDAMLMPSNEPDLVRIVEGLEGRVDLDLEIIIRFEYGSIIPWVERTGRRSFHAIAGPDTLEFYSPVDFKSENFKTRASFRVAKGDRLPFELSWHPSHRHVRKRIEDPCKAVDETRRHWEKWSNRCQLAGAGRELMQRSLLTLKALTYAPTGGIVAAPTTSLPESLGGSRNWDYRYCWVRDSTFTLYSLLMAGYRREAQEWRDWFIRAVAGTPSQVNIMYGLEGERRLSELELDWLSGYEESRPVRIGNAAHQQTQLDIFGELMDTNFLALKSGLRFNDPGLNVQAEMLGHLEKIWDQPDEGIWEMRGPKRQFTHSKLMAWVAFDRAVKIAERLGRAGDVDRWRRLRDQIHADVCQKGFHAEKNAFVQAYGSDELDASLLQMAQVGFLPASDPRLVGTVAAIERELMHDGLVLRYRNALVDDGLPGSEGCFVACSFWLANNYILQGRHDEAKRLFERLLNLRNDVGLLSEEYDVVRKRQTGNFPQAFSHIALVNTAMHFYGSESPVHDRCSFHEQAAP